MLQLFRVAGCSLYLSRKPTRNPHLWIKNDQGLVLQCWEVTPLGRGYNYPGYWWSSPQWFSIPNDMSMEVFVSREHDAISKPSVLGIGVVTWYSWFGYTTNVTNLSGCWYRIAKDRIDMKWYLRKEMKTETEWNDWMSQQNQRNKTENNTLHVCVFRGKTTVTSLDKWALANNSASQKEESRNMGKTK